MNEELAARKKEVVAIVKAAAVKSATWPALDGWPELWFGRVEVSSELRHAILNNCNTDNRKVSSSHVQNIRLEMKAKQYDPWTSFVSFTDDNTLADGQHRLKGIPEGGTQDFFIVIGIPVESRKKIDIMHRLRDSVTNRQFAGESVNKVDKMRYRLANWIGKLHRQSKSGLFAKVPQSAEDAVLRRHNEAINCVVNLAEEYGCMGARQAVCAALVRMFELHPLKAKVFVSSFFADERGKEGDPVRALLRYMDHIRNVGGGRGSTGNSGREGDQYRKANYAINAFIQGRTCKSLTPKRCSDESLEGDEDSVWAFRLQDEEAEPAKKAA